MAEWSAGTVSVGSDGLVRCAWATRLESDAQLLKYHDEEWGIRSNDVAADFEALSLGVFQAGLGWLTVLHKREAFQRAFLGFDPGKVASMTPNDIETLMQDATIIRNRAKIQATVDNAKIVAASPQALFDVAHEFAVAGRERPRSGDDVQVSTAEAVQLSARLKQEGYRFVGPTSVYAFMQSIGVVNDHIRGCVHGDAIDKRRLLPTQKTELSSTAHPALVCNG
jgi:DNA-3-methyladenine glycosylase I